MYKEDFEQERKDREAMNDQLEELKEKSTIINRLETANKTLVKCNPQTLEQLQEDYQISQSQIILYKKQLDACKKELGEERNKGQMMQGRIDALSALLEKIDKNSQMEQTRANRVEQEMQQLHVQYRELEKLNTQLKSSNQV